MNSCPINVTPNVLFNYVDCFRWRPSRLQRVHDHPRTQTPVVWNEGRFPGKYNRHHLLAGKSPLCTAWLNLLYPVEFRQLKVWGGTGTLSPSSLCLISSIGGCCWGPKCAVYDASRETSFRGANPWIPYVLCWPYFNLQTSLTFPRCNEALFWSSLLLYSQQEQTSHATFVR